jgi:hypothetical protein
LPTTVRAGAESLNVSYGMGDGLIFPKILTPRPLMKTYRQIPLSAKSISLGSNFNLLAFVDNAYMYKLAKRFLFFQFLIEAKTFSQICGHITTGIGINYSSVKPAAIEASASVRKFTKVKKTFSFSGSKLNFKKYFLLQLCLHSLIDGSFK